MTQARMRAESGFTMIELMAALVISAIVSSAVYGLITAGGTAFQREPAMSDRQQNIRVALDVVSRDVYRAGFGLPQFAQAFTDGLDAVGPLGAGGSASDEIEMLAAVDCPNARVCATAAVGGGTSLTTYDPVGPCYTFPTPVILADPAKVGIFWAEAPAGGTTASCPGGVGRNGQVLLPGSLPPLLDPPGGLAGWTPRWMTAGQVIRYRIRSDAEGVPSLERSTSGGRPLLDGSSSWRLLARGIEDLQLDYQNGAGWGSTPGRIGCGPNCGAPTTAEYDTIVRRVRIQLSARSTESGLQGQTTSAVGSALRGELRTEIAPRTAATTLGVGRGEL